MKKNKTDWLSFRILAFFRQFYSLFLKDFLVFKNRRKYIYLSFLLPIFLALIYMLMIGNSNQAFKVGLCDFENSDFTNSMLDQNNNFDVVRYKNKCLESMVSDLKDEKIIVGFVIRDGFSNSILNYKQADLEVYLDNSDLMLYNMMSWKVDVLLNDFKKSIIYTANQNLKSEIKSIRSNVNLVKKGASYAKISRINDEIESIDNDFKKIENIENDFLVNPIKSNIKAIYNGVNQKSMGFVMLAPTVLMFVILMLVSITVVYDKKSNLIVRFKSSTVSFFSYVISKISSFFVIGFFQFMLIFVVFLMFGAKFNISYLAVLIGVFVIVCIDVLLGLLVGLISENEGIAVLFSLLISLPLMFLSGLFYPVKLLPSFVQMLSKFLPLDMQIKLLKSIFLFGEFDLSVFFVLIVVFYIVLYFVYRKV